MKNILLVPVKSPVEFVITLRVGHQTALPARARAPALVSPGRGGAGGAVTEYLGFNCAGFYLVISDIWLPSSQFNSDIMYAVGICFQ